MEVKLLVDTMATVYGSADIGDKIDYDTDVLAKEIERGGKIVEAGLEAYKKTGAFRGNGMFNIGGSMSDTLVRKSDETEYFTTQCLLCDRDYNDVDVDWLVTRFAESKPFVAYFNIIESDDYEFMSLMKEWCFKYLSYRNSHGYEMDMEPLYTSTMDFRVEFVNGSNNLVRGSFDGCRFIDFGVNGELLIEVNRFNIYN